MALDHDDDGFAAGFEADRRAVLFPLAGGKAASPAKVIAPAAERKPAIWADDEDWLEQQTPPRPWIVPGHLMRGAVTLVAGMGSAGKSSLMVGWACAIALGEPLGRFEPRDCGKVVLYNVEDDLHEQRRRIAAALRTFGRNPRDVAGRIVRCGPTDVGTLIERDATTGEVHTTAAWEDLVALLEAQKPDVVVLDPLVELHTAEENDNTALRSVIAKFRALAQQQQIAVVLIHHARKGSVAGDMDGVRGAGSLVGAARSVFTVTPMTEEEAADLGIAGDLRRRFVRVDSAKANYAPASDASWHELQEYLLENGETIAAILPWTPPQTASRGASTEQLTLIAAALERGIQGAPYSPRLALDEMRSAGALMAHHGITTEKAQKATLRALYAQGFTVQEWADQGRRKRKGLRAPNGAPAARWCESQAPQAGLLDE
jgi:hypothetical protein